MSGGALASRRGAQPNMMASPPTDFTTQASLQLLVWFNDGVNGFAMLNPPQNLTPTQFDDLGEPHLFQLRFSRFLQNLCSKFHF